MALPTIERVGLFIADPQRLYQTLSVVLFWGYQSAALLTQVAAYDAGDVGKAAFRLAGGGEGA